MLRSDRILRQIAQVLDTAGSEPAGRETPVPVAHPVDRHPDNTLLETRISAILRDSQSADPWINRARPSFLYVMYALLLCAIPVGLTAAVNPAIAAAIAKGMSDYLSALPDPLYALFGTGYLGYTAAREWGKSRA